LFLATTFSNIYTEEQFVLNNTASTTILVSSICLSSLKDFQLSSRPRLKKALGNIGSVILAFCKDKESSESSCVASSIIARFLIKTGFKFVSEIRQVLPFLSNYLASQCMTVARFAMWACNAAL